MNYLIKIGDKDVIISKEEYEEIKEGIKNKSNLIFLRNGNLCINPISIKLIKETDEMTDIEIKQKDEYLRLPPEKRENKTSEIKNIRSGSGLAHISVGGDFKNCEQCGISHFIPEEKTICLGCVGKNKFVNKLKLWKTLAKKSKKY